MGGGAEGQEGPRVIGAHISPSTSVIRLQVGGILGGKQG